MKQVVIFLWGISKTCCSLFELFNIMAGYSIEVNFCISIIRNTIIKSYVSLVML